MWKVAIRLTGIAFLALPLTVLEGGVKSACPSQWKG